MISHLDYSLLNNCRGKIAEEMQRDADALTAGTIKTFDDYKQRVGHHQGLRDALAVMEEIARTMADPDSTAQGKR